MKISTLSLQHFVKTCLAFPLVILALSSLHGAVITPLDGLSTWGADWTDANWDGKDYWTVKPSGPSDIGKITIDGKDYLQISRITGGNGIVFWNGNDDVVNGMFTTDYSGSIILRYSGGATDPFGVLIGAENKTYDSIANTAKNNQAFYIGVIPNAGLGIWFNQETNQNSKSGNVVIPNDGDITWSGFTSTLLADTDYLLSFSISGNLLSASLTSLDETVTYGMVSYTTGEGELEGFFGLQGGRYGNTRYRYFRDLEINVIPEPSTITLLALACGVGFLCSRRRN